TQRSAASSTRSSRLMARLAFVLLVATTLLLGSWDMRPSPVVLTGLDLVERGAGRHEFGPITLPSGATSIQVPISRDPPAHPDVKINWGIDVYREREREWWPGGGAGTIGQSIQQRGSAFIVPVHPGTRIIRGWLRLSSPSTTSLALMP